MKPLTEREIQDLLTPRDTPEPPAGLAEAIKREIPAEIVLVSDTSEVPDAGAPRTISMPRSRVWLMAASVAMAVGGGFLAWRFMDLLPASQPDSSTIASATVPEAPVATEGIDPPASAAAAWTDSALPAGQPGEAEVFRSRPVVPPTAADAVVGVGTLSGAAEKKKDASRAEPESRAGREGVRESANEDVRFYDSVDVESTAPIVEATKTQAAQRVAVSGSEAGQEQASVEERSRDLRKSRNKPVADLAPETAPAPPATPTAVLPPPPPPSARPPARLEARDGEAGRTVIGASPAPGNASIEQGNAQIRDMRKEAAALEAELRSLEMPKPKAAPQSGNAEEAVIRSQARLESLPVQQQPLEAVNMAPGVASTGGTAEPNDAPYGDVFFEGPGTNPFIDTEDDALSTFGLDVDTGSYTVGRRYLRDGHLPAPESVRPEEYVNYFDYGDPAPEGKDEFAVHAEGAPSIYGEGERYYLLRFNLNGREIAREDRRPAMLTFVVDVSGSMGRENRLGLVKRALALLLDQLRADDRVALVVYGSRGRVVLEPTGDLGALRRAIDSLRTEGATNAEDGLTLAYDLADHHRRRGAINRVILCSDGVANVGRTSAGSILERVREEANRGIELTTVGFGMGNYNDVMMERLADDGNGRYAYVDTLDEARRIFVENLTGTLQTLAAEARVQVEFDPETVSRYRLVGYENRDIADHRFRDDTVDAGEIGAGHTVTALYELKTHRELKSRDEVATLHLRYGSVARGKMVELSRTVTGADFARRWDGASPALRLTSLVAEYAEILKHSYWAREGDLDDVFRRAQKVSGELAGDREVADFVSLVGQAARLKEREPER